MRSNVADRSAPALRTPRIAGDTREFFYSDARRKAHLIVIILLNHGIGAAELPRLILILRGNAAREVFAEKSGRHRLGKEAIHGDGLPKPEVRVGSNAAIVK